MNRFCIICILVFVSVKQVGAQNGLQIIEGPLQTIHCDSNCTTLHANFAKPKKTNQYQISNIPYTPFSPVGTNISLNDEKFSGAIPLNFSFCFFEQVYTECYVSDNGILTFNPAFNGANCNNNTQQLLPYFNSTFPDNAILLMFMDVNPNLGGTITYNTSGTAPFRKFTLTYNNVRLFGLSCSSLTSSFQLILYETTNIIDIQIKDKAICDASSTNYANFATVGIQNIGATLAYTAPGKHASIFTVTNQAIRIEPSGPPNYLLKWKNAANATIASNVDSIYFCPPTFPYNKIRAEINYYCPNIQFKDSVIIAKNLPDIDSIVIVKPICIGDSSGVVSLYASGANPPFTYSMSGGPFSSNNVFTGLTTGYIYFSVKDNNGCIVDTLLQILPQYQVLIAVDSIIKPECPDSNGKIFVHALNGVPPYTYTWSNGDTGPMADSLTQGTYLVTVTDSNGCIGQRFINVVFDSLPVLQSQFTKPICHDSSGSIQISVTNGHAPYTYSWSNGSTTTLAQNLWAGLHSVVVTDDIGCLVTAVFVLVDTLTTQTEDTVLKHTTCNLANGHAKVLGKMGLPPYTYLWWPSGQTNSDATGLSAGMHICTTKDANGCTQIDTLYIDSSLGLINQISFANANCDSNNGKIYLNGVLNHTGPFHVLWSTGDTNQLITGLSPGMYWVQTTDSIGCIKKDTIYLLNDGKPHLKIISYTAPLCYGDTSGSVTLSGLGGTAPYKYSLDGINYTSVAQLTGISGGLFTIYIKDANSCPNDTLVSFAQPLELLVGYTADTVICFDDPSSTVNIQVSGGLKPYQYSFNGAAFGQASTFQNLTQGNYSCIIKDSNACIKNMQVIVPGPTAPLEIITNKKDIPCFEVETGSLEVNLQGGWPPYDYTWSNGAQGLSFDSLGPQQISIEVIDEKGCVVTQEINVKQLLCCKAVIPNAFSPNNDTKNDRLRILPISEVSSVKLLIYNRWGQLIFSTKNLQESWDGTYQNVACDVGVYFYYLEYTCPFQKEKMVLKGDITLLR